MATKINQKAVANQQKAAARLAKNADEEKRTTRLGLFNFAHSYWRGAVALQSAHVKDATHPRDPVYFLYCHAVELFLKAFLRANGTGAVELREKFGHDIPMLTRAAVKAGLVVEGTNAHTIAVIDVMNPMSLRYMMTGMARRVDFDRLDDLCRHLHGAGFALLKSLKHPMRKYPDPKPT